MTREEAELLSKKYVMESDIAMREYRNATIEEFAQFVKEYAAWRQGRIDDVDNLIAAIRALKDKS